MNKKILLQVFFLGIVFFLQAKIVPVDLAKTVAENAYKERMVAFALKNYSVELQLKKVYKQGENPLMYLFENKVADGFVLVAADDLVEPVLAYSFESRFNEKIPAVKHFVHLYEDQIRFAREKRLTASDKIKQHWAAYLLGVSSTRSKAIKTVGPLLKTLWNQDLYYNTSCPKDADGPDGHVYVGCVALSMGQAMKYYNYPAYGTGSAKSYDSYNGGYGTFTVSFARHYNWRNMPFKATVYNKDLADLLFHLGVAVRMNWGPDGSGTSSGYIVSALKNYFYYSDSVRELNRGDYSDSEWVAILKNEIDHKRPIVYSGYGDGGGHAWNCDGYQDEKFHMNWGWGGSSNGYYSLDDLTAGGYTFNDYQQAIIYIEPKNNYPSGCVSVNDTIDGTEGSFDDGSGYYDYQNNMQCEYLLAPKCASQIILSFDEFDLDTNDQLIIYDGASDRAPVLDTLSGKNKPYGTEYVASADSLFLKFITDTATVAQGWTATYTTEKCRGTKVLTDTSGIITDGSKGCDYNNNSYCIWKIEPDNHPHAILISFTQWDMPEDDDDDFVKIYKERINSSNTLAKYTGLDSPKAILVEDSIAIIRFYSDRSVTAGGWTIEYTTVGVGVSSQQAFLQSAKVYPNPFKTDASVEVVLKKQDQLTISVYNILGEHLGNYTATLPQGKHTFLLSNLVSSMNDQVYFVHVRAGNTTKVLKLIKL